MKNSEKTNNQRSSNFPYLSREILDFAEIRTQQDVDQFNQQYDVTLTLPQEG